jgi:hypothetical protein
MQRETFVRPATRRRSRWKALACAVLVAGCASSEVGAPWVKVAVAKPGAIPAARDVGVVIERTTADYA